MRVSVGSVPKAGPCHVLLCVLRGKEDLQLRQFLEGMRGSWLAGRAQGWQPALSAVGWAVELSQHCDRSTSCEVAAEVLRCAPLPLELVEVNVLGC